MDKWADRAALWFAVGVMGHISAGFLIGYISGASLEIKLDFQAMATFVGSSAALLTALIALYAFGDWKRSLRYGRMLENAQDLKIVIIRLQAALLRFSDYKQNEIINKEFVDILRGAQNTIMKSYQQEVVKASSSSLREIEQDIEGVMNDYKVAWELLKPGLRKHDDISLISYDNALSFRLGVINELAKCARKEISFRDVNKFYISGRIEDMLDRVDHLLR